MNLFLALYGGLTLIGVVYIVLVISRQQDVPGAAGFMVMFGAGMCFMTRFNGRKPRVIVQEELTELNQLRKNRSISGTRASARSRG